MAHLKQKGKYLYLKYYDRISGKHKEFSTKIEATKSGWAEARKLLREFESRYNLDESFVTVKRTTSNGKNITEGFKEFIANKTLKKKTITLYERTLELIIEGCGNKEISEYGNADYRKFLQIMKQKKFSNTTLGIYTAHANALFNFFVELGYLKENPIKTIPRKMKPPESIDDSDILMILRHLEAKEKKDQYNFILFLLITGFRISSAIELRWEDIDWNNEFILATNVKTDRKFFFPLTEDLKILLRNIGVKKEGKVFNYSKDGLKFFRRLQKRLLEQNKISKYYKLHQLRKTFITKLLEQGIPVHVVKSLADHSNISTTINYYAAVNIKNVKRQLDSTGIFGGIFGGKELKSVE